jgi:hypothetical protein
MPSGRGPVSNLPRGIEQAGFPGREAIGGPVRFPVGEEPGVQHTSPVAMEREDVSEDAS